MSSKENDNDTESGARDGKQSGSQVLIGFCAVVLVLFAVMLNNPEQVAAWGSRFFGWKTPKQQCIQNLKYMDGAIQQWALENKKLGTDTCSLTDPDLLAYLRGSVLPLCPRSGRYSEGKTVSYAPRCTVPGHTL